MISIATIVILIALIIFLLTALIAYSEMRHIEIEINCIVKRNHRLMKRWENNHDN